MQHFKRLTALVMAAVMVLSLVGCGGTSGTTAQKRPEAAPQLQKPVQIPAATTPEATKPAIVTPRKGGDPAGFPSRCGSRPGQPGAGGAARHRQR